jgi:hypothetical protein
MMKMALKGLLLTALTLVCLTELTIARHIEVINQCSQGIMVRTLGNAGLPTLGERHLNPGERINFGFSNEWSGRLWGNNSPGATLFEIAFNQYNDLDFYNLSVIDGFNFGMRVRPVGGGGAECKWYTCTYRDCPDAYQLADDDTRKPVVSACKDANYQVTFPKSLPVNVILNGILRRNSSRLIGFLSS